MHNASRVVGRVRGVTVLDNIMYVVCEYSSTVLLYNMDTLSPLDAVINVDGMDYPCDIVVCHNDRQLYIAGFFRCIWRVSVDDHSDQQKWLSTESPVDTSDTRTDTSSSDVETESTFEVDALSLTSRRLLVRSQYPPRLRQYSTTDRRLLRVVQLPGYVKYVYHGIETTRGTFVVGHRGTSQDKLWLYAVSEPFRCCHLLAISIAIYCLTLSPVASVWQMSDKSRAVNQNTMKLKYVRQYMLYIDREK